MKDSLQNKTILLPVRPGNVVFMLRSIATPSRLPTERQNPNDDWTTFCQGVKGFTSRRIFNQYNNLVSLYSYD